jgi:uncharacterized membrane protein
VSGSMWSWILLASAVAYLTKLSGYLVPSRWLQNERMTHVAGALTVGLLASLTAVNAFSAGAALALDARLGALIAAAIALLCRAPFLAVVVVGAGVAALIRFLA